MDLHEVLVGENMSKQAITNIDVNTTWRHHYLSWIFS